jgi:predicted transcriptional regulator
MELKNMAIKRSTAYRVRISSLVNGEFLRQEGFNPSYIIINKNQVSRINIIATIVSKYLTEDGNYCALTLDDGSETIRAKAFGVDVAKIKESTVGSLVRFIGKVKEYNDEIYLIPEVIKENIDPNWLLIDLVELGKPEFIEIDPEKVITKKDKLEVIEVKESNNPNLEIINLIKSYDSGEGTPVTDIIKNSKLNKGEAKTIIVSLLKSGEIFEPKKGILKLLE